MISIKDIEELFKSHYRSAVFYFHRMTGEQKVAEDIVHNVFLKMISKDITITGSLESYLYSSVHNSSIDHLRRKKPVTLEDLNEARHYSDIMEFSSESPDYQQAMQVRRLHEAIESLPEKCRIIFKKIQLEQMSYKETADSLGVSVNTVRTQMYRAMRHLKKVLKA